MEVRVTPERYYGKTGESFTLTCNAPRPWHSMVWTRTNGQPLPYNSERSDDDTLLIVHNARPEDSGVYMCKVTSLSGSRGNATAYVEISTTSIG